MMQRRRHILALGAGALLPAWSLHAQAQGLDKPVRMIVAYGPGSATDTIARHVADRIARQSGKPAIVENKPGADGNIAAEAAARAPGDAYTLLVSGVSTHAANVTIYKKLAYDPENDFTPVAPLASAPFILVVNPQRTRERSLKEFIAHAKSSNAGLSFASTSVGNRVAGERFRQVSQLQAVNVPYRVSAQAMTDLLGGQFDFYFCDVATALPQIRAGKIVALAVSTRERVPSLPEVPTIAESGFGDFDVASWIAMWSAVASTPPEVSARLSRWVGEALGGPEGREFLLAKGLQPLPTDPETLRAMQRRDTAAWGKVIKEAGLQQP